MSLMQREIAPLTGLTVNVPEWFKDEAFLTWLNDPANPVFTWHTKGQPAGEWSDVVVCVDPGLTGEGSESDMPTHLWDQLIELCRSHFAPSTGSHIHVRLTNLD